MVTVQAAITGAVDCVEVDEVVGLLVPEADTGLFLVCTLCQMAGRLDLIQNVSNA